jgi:hypothetical protein
MRIHTCQGREMGLQILTLPTLSTIFTFSSASMHQNKVLLLLYRVKNNSQKFVWRHPISMNILYRKEEGFYAYP